MSHYKNYFFSILVSISFPISTIIGNAFGLIFGKILYWQYDTLGLNIPTIIKQSGPTLISGIIGGLLAGFICVKLYKNIHLISSMILPTLIIILITLASLYKIFLNENFLSKDVFVILANILSLFSYFYIIQNHIKGIK
jgi:hypothetical protein